MLWSVASSLWSVAPTLWSVAGSIAVTTMGEGITWSCDCTNLFCHLLTSIVDPSQSNNIEMKDCPAYGDGRQEHSKLVATTVFYNEIW